MNHLLIVTLQVIAFVGYVIYIWGRFGVLTSISVSSYKLEGNEQGLFSGWLIALALLSCLYIYANVLGVWAGFMAVGFAISGMSPDHKRNPNSLEDAFHTAGSILIIIAGFAGLYFIYDLYIQLAVFITGTILLKVINKNWIWWAEILGMLTIAWGLFSL